MGLCLRIRRYLWTLRHLQARENARIQICGEHTGLNVVKLSEHSVPRLFAYPYRLMVRLLFEEKMKRRRPRKNLGTPYVSPFLLMVRLS